MAKRVKLKFEDSILQAVDENGNNITNLIGFTSFRAIAFPEALRVLRENGYDTSFAKWGTGRKIKIEYGRQKKSKT